MRSTLSGGDHGWCLGAGDLSRYDTLITQSRGATTGSPTGIAGRGARIGTPDSWDRGLPDPGSNAVGHVVAHRSPVGSPRATFMASMGAVPGASMALGDDNPLDIGHPGPLVVSVLSLDPAESRVRIVLTRRPARVIIDLPSLIPDPSKIDDGLPPFIVSPADPGTMVWTREGGLRPLAKGSPAEEVVRAVAQVQALYDLSRVASDDEVGAIAGRTAEAVDALTQAVRAVSVEPPRSSFSGALERLAALERTQAEVGRRSQIPELVEAMEKSRSDLSAVRELLTDAIRRESERDR